MQESNWSCHLLIRTSLPSSHIHHGPLHFCFRRNMINAVGVLKPKTRSLALYTSKQKAGTEKTSFSLLCSSSYCISRVSIIIIIVSHRIAVFNFPCPNSISHIKDPRQCTARPHCSRTSFSAQQQSPALLRLHFSSQESPSAQTRSSYSSRSPSHSTRNSSQSTVLASKQLLASGIP